MTSKSLENYVPADLRFVVGEEATELFPQELDFLSLDGLDSKRDVMRFVSKNFTATFPENEYATRLLDDHEKSVMRGEYCVLVENILPERKRQLEEALEEAKRLKKEAEELYASTLQEITAMAAEVKLGTVESRLKGTDTFCMALAGYYLTYTWNEAKQVFVLAKATPARDSSLWSSDEKNRQMMLECFGVELPEPEGCEEAEIDGDF